MRRAILTEIVRKNVKNAIAKTFTKHHLEKSIATVPKIPNDRLEFDMWLTYRTFALKRPLRLTWRQLYRQFGADPAKASKVAQQAFRRDCLRELKKIKNAWPDLHYHTVTGALVLSPSPPRIAPSQLRLVE